jgi:hypothetical protein
MTKLLPVNGKSSLHRVITFYSLLWRSTYGRSPTIEWGRWGKALKPLFENYSEYQLALMLMQFFSWRGANNDDDFVHKKLSGACFPITWFPTTADSIAVYIQNALGITLDNETEVCAIVDKKLHSLK